MLCPYIAQNPSTGARMCAYVGWREGVYGEGTEWREGRVVGGDEVVDDHSTSVKQVCKEA